MTARWPFYGDLAFREQILLGRGNKRTTKVGRGAQATPLQTRVQCAAPRLSA